MRWPFLLRYLALQRRCQIVWNAGVLPRILTDKSYIRYPECSLSYSLFVKCMTDGSYHFWDIEQGMQLCQHPRI
jgi:hypothetical protein